MLIAVAFSLFSVINYLLFRIGIQNEISVFSVTLMDDVLLIRFIFTWKIGA